MTEKLSGRIEFRGGDGDSIISAIDTSTELWIQNGLRQGQIIGAQKYLCDDESPHMCRVPNGATAYLLTWIDPTSKPVPSIRAAVEVESTDFTYAKLEDCISSPDKVGNGTSKGDKKLLNDLRKGKIKTKSS